jgi:hypothetical protein
MEGMACQGLAQGRCLPDRSKRCSSVIRDISLASAARHGHYRWPVEAVQTTWIPILNCELSSLFSISKAPMTVMNQPYVFDNKDD